MNAARVEIIAEFCQNHGGDFSVLEAAIHRAAKAGATIGKIQTIFANRLQYRPQFEATRPFAAEYKRLQQLELDWPQHRRFVTVCKAAGLVPATTCFTLDTTTEVRRAGFETVKVASYDCGSVPLLLKLRGLFGQVIISTGASYPHEVETAAALFREHNFFLLHCCTLYPTPLAQCHLAKLRWLRQLTPNFGYSDHTPGTGADSTLACKVAIHLGARCVERHVRTLPVEQTKDGPVSVLPEDLRAIADFAKLGPDQQRQHLNTHHPNWQATLGYTRPKLSKQELQNRKYYRGRFASKPVQNWEVS